MQKLNEKVQEFAEIAKTLPENLQAVCFELLLRDHLEAMKPGSAGKKTKAGTPEAASTKEQVDNVIEMSAADTSNQEDFKLTDLHVKVRKFLAKYNLSIEHINNVFFQEAQEVKPLYDDLKTTKTSESQIRITLLLALRKAIRTGAFEAETTVVKDECSERKCYDVKNFGNNFNNNKSLFTFDKFTKDTSTIGLAEHGKATLAELLKGFQ